MIGTRSKYGVLNSTETYYTKGGEFFLDGKNYKGEYHFVDGKIFSGPVNSTNPKELTKYYGSQDLFVYDKLYNFNKIESTFKQPTVKLISPADTDYDLGYYQRYFLQSLIDTRSIPIEIGPDEIDILGTPGGYDNQANDFFSLKWTLTGPLRTTGNYIGIFEKNYKVVLEASAKYPNIVYSIKNFTQFAKPTIL